MRLCLCPKKKGGNEEGGREGVARLWADFSLIDTYNFSAHALCDTVSSLVIYEIHPSQNGCKYKKLTI